MRIFTTLLLAATTAVFCTDLDAQRKRGKRGGGAGAIFKKLDKNEDGKISKAEAKGSRLEKRFDKIDKNEDGFITKDELGKGRRGKGRRGKKGKKGQRGGK